MSSALPCVFVVDSVVQELSVSNAAKAVSVKLNLRCLDDAVMIFLLKDKGLVSTSPYGLLKLSAIV